MRICSVEGCGKKHYANNYCHLHNQRWKRLGDPLDPGSRLYGLTVPERFWARVDKSAGEEGCWPYTGRINADGYGIFWDGTKHESGANRLMGAHRYSFILNHGEVPEGKEVCHSCDNPPCVNPQHLYADTHASNASRAWKLGRNTPRYGEDNPKSKMTVEKVTAARELYATTDMTINDIARRFGVTGTAMGHILKGHYWKQVPMPPGLPRPPRR